MEREIVQELVKWRNNDFRIPLLLRGARQIGKTFIIEKFAKQYFKNFVEINFEYEPIYSECFQSFNPHHVISAISNISRQKIVEGETLLFLDEIQNCPKAIMTLRYFKEKMPKLHVIGAGSLLEFSINDENFSMPVGRVQYIYMKPFSFREFLFASKYNELLNQIKEVTLDEPLSNALHNKLLSIIREYLITGGMPEAIQNYLETHDYVEAQYKQTIILNTYRNDFGKYAKKTNHKYLQKVFDKTPALLSQQIKYNKIEPTMRSRELEQAIEDLNNAGIIRRIYATSASGLPLHALINEKKFKLLFLDVGLAVRATQLTISDMMHEDINLLNEGAVAEQFVGQELLAYQNCYLEPQLHYWYRDVVGSQAEVDYIITHDSQMLPIEVKSGKTGKLKSMHMFMRDKKIRLGIRISELPLAMNNNILSIPFYLISELPRLIEMYG